MQVPERPKQKPSAKAKDARGSFALRMDRAADGLNPFLVILTIGLLALDLTLYVGLSVSREPLVLRAAHQLAAPISPGGAAAAAPDASP